MLDSGNSFFQSLFGLRNERGEDAVSGWIWGGVEEATPAHGRWVARYGPRMLIALAITSMSLAILGLLCLLYGFGGTRWTCMPFAIFSLLSTFALVNALGTRIEFSRDELIVVSIWKGRRMIPWSAVQGLDYSIIGHRLLRAGEFGDIPVGSFLSGGRDLLKLAHAILRERQLRDQAAAIDGLHSR